MKPPADRRPPDRPSRPRRRRLLPWAATGLVLGLATLGLVAVARSAGGHSPIADAPCARRVVIIELSSSVRTDQWRDTVVDTTAAALASAAVCKSPFAAYAVGGGGRVTTLVNDDDVAVFTPTGPTPDVRRSQFGNDSNVDVRNLVIERFNDAIDTAADVDTTTISAMYTVAAEHVDTDTDVVIVTDGVNQDDDVDLNRPLNGGDGGALAERVTVPTVGNRQTTIVGIAQIDATAPAPGGSWPAEIRAFNAALCALSGAASCRLYTTASPTEVLAVTTEGER